MSFFTPLFLLGVLAVAGPILFHLIRRTTREVTPFSSLMFLQPTPPRVTRRSRLENIWLLILRCLAVALLALAFARPFFQRESASATPPAGSGKRSVLLVDTSASMRREQLWDDARKAAGEQLREKLPTDEVALLTFDRSVQTLVSFEDWQNINPGERTAVAVQRLAAVTPGWGATHLDRALLRATELLDDSGKNSGAVRREIVLISDLQEGGRLDALQGYEWPAGVEVVLLPVLAKQLGNASAHWIAGDEAETTGENLLRIRVSADAESKREQFQLRWSAERATSIDAYVPSGQSRIIRVPPPPAGISRLVLTGDGIEFDNTLHILPVPAAQLSVIFLGADANEDPGGLLYFLRRAFPKTAQQNIEIIADQGAAAVPAFQLQKAQLLILGQTVPEVAVASARQFAADGKTVLLPLASATEAETLARLFQMPQISAAEATVKDYGLLAQIDFQHPLFAPFADPRFSDFTKVSFWKWRRLGPAPLPGAQVVARFDNGDPAIIQAPLGKGSVVIFTTTWRPKDSQLALSSKFVPLLNGLLEQSANFVPPQAQYFVGDELSLRPEAQTVRTPAGADVPVTGAKFSGTSEPGIYTVNPGATPFVVNLAPDESRVTPWPPERFTSLGVPIRKMIAHAPAMLAHDPARARAADLASRHKVWRWMIVAVLGVLLLETIFAGRVSRTVAATQP